MLQDIEKRKANKEDGQSSAMMSKLVVPAVAERLHLFSFLRRFWVWIILLLVTIIFLFTFVGSNAKKASAKASTETLSITKAAPPKKATSSETTQTALAVSVAPSKASAALNAAVSSTPSTTQTKETANLAVLSNQPATLDAISVVRQTNQVDVQFNLSHKVHYQLQVADNHQKLILKFANTSVTDALPTVPPDDIIKAVSTATVHGQLQVTVEIQPGTEVQSLSYNNKQANILSLVLGKTVASLQATQQAKLEKSVVPLSPSEIAMRDYQKALTLISSGQTDEAISLLEQALIIKHDLIEPREALIVLLLQQKSFAVANKYIAEGLTQMSNYTPYIELKARVLTARGQFRRALYVLQQHSPSLTDYPNYYALMAVLQQRMGQASQAVQLYGQLIAAQGNNAKWWLGLGYALEADNRPNAAVEAYRHTAMLGGLTPQAQVFVNERIQQLGG